VWLVVAPLGESSWRLMFVVGVLPAVLLLYIRTGVRNPEVWVAANARRRAAREREARGQTVAPEERGLLRFTMAHVVSDPVLRWRLGLLLLMSLTSVVGWWATSTWIPQYVGQVAATAGYNAADWASRAGLIYNLGSIAGYVAVGFLADAWGRKPTILFFYAGSLILVQLLFLGVKDPTLLLATAAVNGFFTSGQFSWMPTYLPELFPTAMRGSAISLVFDTSRYVAAAGPLLAGWLAVSLGGINTAAALIGLIYILGLVVTPFAGPETKGQPLPE
jgi:MFS family permease